MFRKDNMNFKYLKDKCHYTIMNIFKLKLKY